MKINYVLIYGTPYLKYELFDTFKKMSDFIVKRSIVNYTIFEKMEDKKEVEMIYRDNDIRVLEKENKSLMKQLIEQDKRIDKTIEQLEEILEMAKDYGEVNLVDRLEIILKILRGKDEK